MLIVKYIDGILKFLCVKYTRNVFANEEENYNTKTLISRKQLETCRGILSVCKIIFDKIYKLCSCFIGKLIKNLMKMISLSTLIKQQIYEKIIPCNTKNGVVEDFNFIGISTVSGE